MRDIKPIVAENLAALRKNRGMTQAELAELFDYSDKAISRWERGDTMPDINVLYELCEFYGVTLDYLVQRGDEHTETAKPSRQNLANRIVMSSLVVSIIWLAVTMIFVYTRMFRGHVFWQIFIWAVPLSCLAVLLTSRSWMPKTAALCLWSGFIWSLLAGIYLQFLTYNFWMIFFIGVPAQVIILLFSRFQNTR